MKLKNLFIAAATLLCLNSLSHSQSPDQPKPIPKDRVQIKTNLDALKSRTPRLPFEKQETINGQPSVHNAMARAYFLPPEWFAGEKRTGLGNSSEELVDYELKTKCFWIVSRGNNCHYCLGHQEHKLHMIGLSDDDIAALDHDWSKFDARTQKALALAKKMTQSPHAMQDEDVRALRPEFNDAQIIELVYTIARFNSTNRWTDAMGIPQDNVMRGEAIHFDSPTSSQWNNLPSLAAPNPRAERELLSEAAWTDFVQKSSLAKPALNYLP